MTDLYKIDKIIAQRNRRNPSAHYQKMADLSKSIIEDKLEANEIISIASEILTLEKLSGERSYQGAKIIRAVEENDYEIKIPYCMQHRLNYDPGHIYILTSKDYPGQSKIGATQGSIHRRIVLFRNRYDTPVDLFYSQYIDNVFQLEKKVHKLIQPLRVSQYNPDGSVEWFNVEAADARDLIQKLINNVKA